MADRHFGCRRIRFTEMADCQHSDESLKAADLSLGRDNKSPPAIIRAGATVLWILLECMNILNILTVVGLLLILCLVILFICCLVILFIWIIWAAVLKRSESNAGVPFTLFLLDLLSKFVIRHCFVNDFVFEKRAVHNSALEFREASADLREAVTGTDKKKFVLVVAVIWVNAVIGSCGSFLLTIFSFTRIRKIRSAAFLKRSRSSSRLQGISIPEDAGHNLASELRFEVNIIFDDLYEAVTGPDKEKFVLVFASLWLHAVIGSWCDYLTLAIVLLVAHTVRFLYEKYEDQIDSFVLLLDSFAHKVSHKVSCLFCIH